MILYTCKFGNSGPPAMHPCAKAVHALRDAGIAYEHRTVPGFKNIPFFGTRGGKRDELVRISGQKGAPVLLLDDGVTTINGSKAIAAWAKANATA